MSLPESRGETNSRGERSEKERRQCDRSTKNRTPMCNCTLTTNIKKERKKEKSTTGEEKTGAALERKKDM